MDKVIAQEAEAVVLVQVTFKRFGNSRKGDLGAVETDAEKGLLRLSKQLIDCPAFQALTQHDTETATWIRKRSIPSMFKAGIYQVRPSYVEKIDGYMTARAEQRRDLVRELLDAYGDAVRDARARLGSQFRELDYPSAAGFAAKFDLEWRFFTLSPPGQVAGISADFIRRESDRLSELFASARAEGLAAVRAEFAGLVDHLIDRLTPGADGRPKRFQASTLENVADFLDAFDARNVAGDAQILKVIDEARRLLKGADPQSIRRWDDVREGLAAGFGVLRAQLSSLITETPRRFVDAAGLGDADEGDAGGLRASA